MTSTPPVNPTALRASRTAGDMAKAVLVLLVPVIVLFAVYVFFFGGGNPIAIDPSGTYGAARAAGKFTVLEPSALAKGWTPISSVYDGGVLRVGYVTPGGRGVQLVEADRPADQFVGSELGGTPKITGTVAINGVTWAQTVAGSAHALVANDAGRTVIVRGDASFDELGTFASALR